jgi:hypothetical protein
MTSAPTCSPTFCILHLAMFWGLVNFSTLFMLVWKNTRAKEQCTYTLSCTRILHSSLRETLYLAYFPTSMHYKPPILKSWPTTMAFHVTTAMSPDTWPPHHYVQKFSRNSKFSTMSIFHNFFFGHRGISITWLPYPNLTLQMAHYHHAQPFDNFGHHSTWNSPWNLGILPNFPNSFVIIIYSHT